ncbi:hypothetical protein [Parasitella parasitica]|uniref:Myb-like domain-containing protein n=1 Tax=Parasitella parasitica TaxID=35722 RepID=A0A0B7NHK5_9FUNG|nr:hypothetical protein [Parasitella parasitica]
MDLKYLLCEPTAVSKLAVKANEKVAIIQQQSELDWCASAMYRTVIIKQEDFDHQQSNPAMLSSPTSVCSSLSTGSSTSSKSSNDDYLATPGRSNSFCSLRAPIPQYHHQYQQQQPDQSRRRTASDVSLTRHHMFIYSHPNRRPRSESAGNTSNVQTRTPWTPYEDHLLQQGYDQGLSWAMISSTYLPHRSRGCCWGRFKTLQNKNMVDPNHSHMRHFRRPWKAIDFTNNKNTKNNN